MAVDIGTSAVSTILNEPSPPNTDDLVLKWLDRDFLEKHLQNFFGDTQITIVNFEVKPATAKGENYASYLYRVKVTYTDETQTCSGRRNSVKSNSKDPDMVRKNYNLSTILKFCN